MEKLQAKDNMSLYTKGKCVGKGSFGVVYEGTHAETGKKIAMKQCIMVNDQQGTIAMKEIKNIKHIILHKHIINMFDFNYAEDSIWILMDFCDKGDLTDYMKKYAPNIDKQLKIMHQCAGAVDHMHSLKVPIVHRDIKPGNILFKTEGKSVVVKLSDFGLSKIIDDIDSASRIKMGTILGTQGYMAPELFARKQYDHTVDTFALGMVYLAMINFKSSDEQLLPLSATFLQSGSELLKFIGQEMYEANLSKSKQPVVVNVSPVDGAKLKAVKKLIVAMTVLDPKNRLPLKGVLKEIESSAVGESTKGMVIGKATASQIFKSNLDLTMTRVGLSLGGDDDDDSGNKDRSSGYGSSGGANAQPTVIPKRKEPEATAEEEPDIGYILMRQMVEAHMKRKREKELKEQKAKAEAAQFAAAVPLLMLLKLLESDSDNATKLEIGDKVIVDTDKQKVRQLQMNYGGWHDKMTKYLGEEGIVKEKKEGRITVQFTDGKKLVWNAHLLEKADTKHKGKSGGLKSSKFKMNDVVRIKVNADELKHLQKNGNAGWRDKMKNAIGIRGAVHQVHHDGDVLVEFMNGDKWWMCPDALEVVDLSSVEIEAGDTVVILEDRRKVQELQKGHGEWINAMEKCLGRSGIVRKVASNHRAIVEIADTTFIWNIKCLKLIAKSEEMLMVMLKKHLLDD